MPGGEGGVQPGGGEVGWWRLGELRRREVVWLGGLGFVLYGPLVWAVEIYRAVTNNRDIFVVAVHFVNCHYK